MVDDLNNGSELTSVSALVDQDNTANFNKSPVGSLDGSFCRHFCCVGWWLKKNKRKFFGVEKGERERKKRERKGKKGKKKKKKAEC